ncbi:MAG: serpin family protein [Wenzhouxiangella sp.]
MSIEVESPAPEEEDMVLDASDQTRFAAGNREFALAAFQQLLDGPDAPDHLLISPHSILSALAMVYAGADGSTREQMRETLHFVLDEPALHQAFAALDEALQERAQIETRDAASGFELSVVNRLWGQQDYGFVPEYLELIERYYGAGVELVDFESDPDGVREGVNAWVEAQTRERIRDLLPEGSVNVDTRLILVNAIYFLASWQDAFEQELTRDRAFTTGSGAVVDVPMMHRTATLAAHVGEDTVAVSLPYLGRKVSLLALMPAAAEADFQAWLSGLNRARFDAVVEGLESKRVALDFPKFTGGSGFRLADLLKTMGMPLAFSPTEADFRRMSGVGPGVMGRSLYIDEVFHQTFIDLDEAGTEAAAATAVAMMRLTAMPVEDDPLEIRFDRPFVYAIYDHPTETILFLGRVLDPLAN